MASVREWIDHDVYDNSVSKYGLPERVKNLVNKEIGREVTYTDILLYLSTFLREKISYLELGVSVGKNFLQVVNFLKNASLVGFDIEEINPVLEGSFVMVDRREWETMAGSAKRKKSSLSLYHHKPNSHDVHYLSGDILDGNSWRQLVGQKFNLIFSDAFHDPSALLFEFEMIAKYELLNPSEFVILWDDLGGDMSLSFLRIWSHLKRSHNLKNRNRVVCRCRGWLGTNEPMHEVGIIMKIAHRENLCWR